MAAAGLLALILGPFVVQCQGPNGAVGAKFLFSECSPDIGCAEWAPWCTASIRHGAEKASDDDCRRQPSGGESRCGVPGVHVAGDSGRLGCAGALCGCSESALFTFLGSRPAPDAGGFSGPRPRALVDWYLPSLPVLTRADAPPTEVARLGSPPHPVGIHRVLRI